MSDLESDYEDATEVSALVHWARVLVFLAIFLGVIALLAPRHAAAHDWAHPELDNWYSSLQATGKGRLTSGTSCCSKQDCHTTEAEIRNGQWWARLGLKHGEDWEMGAWVPVPDEIIVRGPNGNPVPNEAGEAVICHPQVYMGQMFDVQHVPIYCFVPPIEY